MRRVIIDARFRRSAVVVTTRLYFLHPYRSAISICDGALKYTHSTHYTYCILLLLYFRALRHCMYIYILYRESNLLRTYASKYRDETMKTGKKLSTNNKHKRDGRRRRDFPETIRREHCSSCSVIRVRPRHFADRYRRRGRRNNIIYYYYNSVTHLPILYFINNKNILYAHAFCSVRADII